MSSRSAGELALLGLGAHGLCLCNKVGQLVDLGLNVGDVPRDGQVLYPRLDVHPLVLGQVLNLLVGEIGRRQIVLGRLADTVGQCQQLLQPRPCAAPASGRRRGSTR